jgi:NAD(P)-dependent dehydrogenase (short-subunit alcohol dehydrogenase family)
MTKTILITGTSSGLGRATAKHFHSQGWNVVATMRHPEHDTEFKHVERMLVTRLDVQDPNSIQTAVDAGIAAFGAIDALVNNAGYGAYGPLEATPIETMRRQFDVNVLGPLATIQALLPHFRARRSGTIVNISSVGGRLTFPLGALYHGSKFALEGLSEALWWELGAIGVRIKIVEPGGMKTDFGGRSLDFNNDPAISEYQPIVRAVTGVLGPMMEKGAKPEDIAAVVYAATIDPSDRLRYEAGDDARYMLRMRREVDDSTYLASIKTQFGLAA